MSLGKRIKEEMPVDRVRAECGICGKHLYDSYRSGTPLGPIEAGRNIEMFAEKHKAETCHNDLQVDLDKPTPRQKIDAKITVNGE